MEWTIWKINYSEAKSYKYSHGSYVSSGYGKIFLQ